MQDVVNYPIKDFLTVELPIDYKYYSQLLNLLTPTNLILKKSMNDLFGQPYKLIITLEKMYKEKETNPYKMIEIVSVAYQVPTEDLEPIGIFDFFKTFNYLHNAYTALIERENRMLHYEPDTDEVEADFTTLSKFGRLPSIDTLAKGNILEHDKITDLPYSRIFTKLYLESEKAKYQKRLFEIRNKPQQ